MTNWHGETAVGGTVEWFTPPELFQQLGMTFDLDPCMPIRRLSDDPAVPPVPWVPARSWWTPIENGLLQPWHGRVWLNPPYGPTAVPFLHRLAEHGDGLALVFSRTETAWWRSVAARADAVCFLRDRVRHVREDGHKGRGAMGSALLVFGERNIDPVVAADLGWNARSLL